MCAAQSLDAELRDVMDGGAAGGDHRGQRPSDPTGQHLDPSVRAPLTPGRSQPSFLLLSRPPLRMPAHVVPGHRPARLGTWIAYTVFGVNCVPVRLAEG